MLFRFVEASGGGFALNDPTVYGQDVPLPVPVVGIPDPARRDLSSFPAFGKADGFWPVEHDETTAEPGQVVVWTYSLDPTRKVVVAKGEASADPNIPASGPAVLGRLQFTDLAQSVGGMTDAMLVEAYKHPAFEAFWIKMQLASQVERDHPVTAQALTGLEVAGFLPDGAAAVLAAWPAS